MGLHKCHSFLGCEVLLLTTSCHTMSGHDWRFFWLFNSVFHIHSSFTLQKYYKKCTYANFWMFFRQIKYNFMYLMGLLGIYACTK